MKKTKVDPIRETILTILVKIDSKQGYINILLSKSLDKKKISTRDAAFITEITYGVVRNRNKLDWAISQFSTKALSETAVLIRNILRMGVYQLLFLDKVPDYAVCNESVQLAKKYGNPGISKFVNGVLRNIIRNRENIRWPDKKKETALYISTIYSHPLQIVERWLKRFGFADTVKICQANNRIPTLVIRTNTLKLSRSDLRGILEKESISVREGLFTEEALHVKGLPNVTKYPAYREGLFQIQDEASILVSHLLDPSPGEFVIDVCSAPGGKATHLAQLMANKGSILAMDSNKSRLIMVKSNCRRLGIDIVKTQQNNGAILAEKYLKAADKVLIDVPCTGLGVLRRKPDLRWQAYDAKRFEKLTELQGEILNIASCYLKIGGKLVYSTCSTEPEENEEIVSKFLEEHPNFELEDPGGFLKERRLEAYVSDQHKEREFIQIYPGLSNLDLDLDGFFMAKMIRKG
ncbi:MAG TPA: 16S rRNA (cytosine(967)-C(5))-methyltransferase RsmB [Candidatus Atribacteria bacterium]|jgi:16S rRNA (cytosine967-C5)-methyltransferase|nr:MAG: Sun protein [Atribacteria bacterium 34_128]HAJ32218.1 16S rRNA (cytosine(967)-C(5))-methyltransferase RsmB [Candidatus Atribacteria bacterium]